MAKKSLKFCAKIAVIAFIIIFLIFRGKSLILKTANRFEIYTQNHRNEVVLKEIAKDETNKSQQIHIPTINQVQKGEMNLINQNSAINKSTSQSPSPTQTPSQPSKLLKVQFICQAPLQTTENWKYHEESCEEAAVLQNYLYETKSSIEKQEAHEEILRMIEWQRQNFGTHKDLYADDLKQFIIGYYGIKESDIKIIYDAGIEDIKKIIDTGHPVIVPIMGDILKNPNYPYPGYHMLIVTGYTEEMIITNDNGTRKGESYSYPQARFLEAMQAAGGDIVSIQLQN